jgi:hypothetical protein
MASTAPVEIKDGYYSNQFLVTLRPSALEHAIPEALSASRGPMISEGMLHNFREAVAANAQALGVVMDAQGGENVVTRSLLSDLERSGLVTRAIPVRRPYQGEAMVSSTLPFGGGRLAAAVAESFSAVGERPSDQILSGSVLITSTPGGDPDELRARLLADDQNIESVERVPIRKLYQAPVPQGYEPIAPWHLDRLRLNQARGQPYFPALEEQEAVRVAVLDTGVDQNHPLLHGRIAVYSYDPPYPGVTSDQRDMIGHGTHVAGTIGANGAIGDIEGVCRARLHIYKIFDDDVDSVKYFQRTDGQLIAIDEHYVNPVMYLRALAACVDNIYDVVNLSIGGPAIGDSREQAHFRTMIEQNQIVVAAMGNDRRSGSPTSWPAAYDGVISVGALDLNDGVASFSNQGDHIDICAPGVDILATMPTYRGVAMWNAKRNTAGQVVRDTPVHWTVYRTTMQGTSMAAPQVAGAAALWIARNTRNLNKFATKLASTARPVPLMNGLSSTPDYGHGCLDVDKLLR